MAETSHARSRRAALAGLVLQFLAAGAVYALSIHIGSAGLAALSMYLAGGIPLWFVALLVFRQHELAELEALDLEELRRERKATGGGEAMFGTEGGGGLGFLVAKTRLEWMQRWLIPLFGLLDAVLLLGLALLAWALWERRPSGDWDRFYDGSELQKRRLELGMVLSTLIMLFLFFFSRYAAGMARVRGWQLLRGCGSYMFGNSFVALVAIVIMGVILYQKSAGLERYLAYGIPVLMALLGAETLINFLFDIYRPRTPGVEARACFDSRLLGMISEPGGIAHSLAEAVNYQFGFKVSHTWFYLLLQKAFIPLAGAGAAVVWLLSCFVVLQPYEHGIIERFGRQIDPEHPLAPGFHVKWPAPFEICRKFNTGQLHEFYIGYRDFDQPDREKQREPDKAWIELWTDVKHGGREHFDFISAPTPLAEQAQIGERAAQHLVRMLVIVQYKIKPQELAAFTNDAREPHDTLRKIAWNEVVQFAASNHIDQLLGEARDSGDRYLRDRIAARVVEMNLGLEIMHVGILHVHPTRDVSEAFRAVVKAQQEKIAEIRKARVTENETLARVAGDKRRALALSQAIDEVQKSELAITDLERALRAADSAQPEAEAVFVELRPALIAHLEAQWKYRSDQLELDLIRRDFELGLGGSLQDQVRAERAVAESRAVAEQCEAALSKALDPIRNDLRRRYEQRIVELRIEWLTAHVALEFWNARLEEYITGLEGQAAVTLAKAQANRWQLEMRADAEVTRLENERHAFAAAPEIYKTRGYLEVLTEGLKEARKYFLAFPQDKTKVHVRIEAQEQPRTDVTQLPVEGVR